VVKLAEEMLRIEVADLIKHERVNSALRRRRKWRIRRGELRPFEGGGR